MDRRDEQNGKMEDIYDQLHEAYCQFTPPTHDSDFSTSEHHSHVSEGSNRALEVLETGLFHPHPLRDSLTYLQNTELIFFLYFRHLTAKTINRGQFIAIWRVRFQKMMGINEVYFLHLNMLWG